MERGRIPLGKAAGIPVGAHWSVVAIFGLIALILGASVLPAQVPDRSGAAYGAIAVIGAIVFLASLLAHELAHAVVAQSHGIRVKRITLWLLGGMAELAESPRDARADFRIAVVGPLMSFVIAAAAFAGAYVLHPWLDPLVTVALLWLGLVNAVVAVFNLLPGAPLDGGRVLRAFIWRRTGDREKASVKAAGVGRFLGFSFIALGILQAVLGALGGLWLALIGWFMVLAAGAERAASSVRQRFGNLRAGDVMSHRFEIAPAWWRVETFLTNTPFTARDVFPVVTFEGEPVGVVSLQELAGVPERERETTAVRDIARPLQPESIVDADTDLGTLLLRTPLRAGRDLLVVMDGPTIVGVVALEDVVRVTSQGDAAG